MTLSQPLANTLESNPAQPSRIPAILAALPDFAMAGTFLITWFAPRTFGDRMVRHLMLVMLLEFIVVHSAGFTAALLALDLKRRVRVIGLLGLSAFYLLFAGAFGVAFATWWPILALLALTANRLAGFLFGKPPDGGQVLFILLGWAASVVAYLGGTFLTLTIPIPPFGITSDVVRMQEITSTGIWPEGPWRMIAFGFVYFTLVGLWELFGASAVSRAKATSAARLS